MRPFEYARPTTESEAVEMLQAHHGDTAVLAGGTDLISLMKQEVVTPARVVDLKHVDSLQGVSPVDDGVLIGALTTLEDLQLAPELAGYAGLLDAAREIRAIQIQSVGTIGGDLCHLPNCWYYRNGYGLLGRDGNVSLPENGEGRFHAIFGNQGPAKFVSATRLAPALIAWGARVRIAGPTEQEEQWLPLEHFYQTPRTDKQHVTVLKPGQLLTHVWLPSAPRIFSATYDVQQLQGLDWPLASAAVAIQIESGVIQHARIVMGHVAPTPWVAASAAQAAIGYSVSDHTAEMIGNVAVEEATPLADNGYKVQLAKTAVKRALLKATNQWQEG